jgi:hypothetical protein
MLTAPQPHTEQRKVRGLGVSPGVYEGTARVIGGTEEFGRIEQGDVLVTNSTTTAFNIVLPLLGAIVTDRGRSALARCDRGARVRLASRRRLHGCHLGTPRRGESHRRRDRGAGRGRRMTKAAAPIEHVRSDVLPPITPLQFVAFQDACAAAAAIHSARELGVIARISEAPADPAAVAADCGLTQQGAAALLSALAGLDLLKLGDDGRFRPACSGLDQLVELFRPWASLSPVLRGQPRPANAATIAGAESLYPSLVSQLGTLFRPSAEQAAELLARPDSASSTSAPVQLRGASPLPRANPVPPSRPWSCTP